MIALMGVVLANMLNAGVPDWLGVILVVLCGALLGGALNGVLIGYIGLSFFLVTLGSMAILHGAVALWTGVETLYINSPLIEKSSIIHSAGIPVPIWIMLGTFLLGFSVLRFAYFGRDVYAVAGNQ